MNYKKIFKNFILSSFSTLIIFFVINFFSLDYSRFDFLMGSKITNQLDNNIVLIVTDETTIKTYSEPAFWTRSRYESLLNEIEKHKPKSVVFDYYFNSKSKPENVDWDLIQKSSWISTENIDRIFENYDNSINDMDFYSSIDRDFVISVRKWWNVFFPYLTTFDKNFNIKWVKIDSFDQLKKYSRSWYVNTVIDKDWTLRKFPLLKSTQYSPLSLNIVNHFNNSNLQLNQNEIYYINYSSEPSKWFQKIPFEFAYNWIFETREGKKVDLKDKIVLIGDYWEIFGDYYKIPVGKSTFMPWIEVLANQIKTILDSSYIKDIWNKNRFLVNGVLYILFLIVFSSISIYLWSIIFFIINLLLIYLDFNFFENWLYMSYIYFVPILFGTFLSPTIFKLLDSYKEKFRLKKFFSKFVGKNIVDLLIKMPQLNLDWEKREITVFFADLKNFTNISEILPPDITINVLDAVFEESNKIIFAHSWTLDKYIWDCIMAFWWAPLPCKNHYDEACMVALELQKSIKNLNTKFSELYWIELNFRIGISTWLVTVGSIGTEEFADYTVIWDRVNLASRIEWINKIYNTNIIITEETRFKLDWRFLVRELDTIRVKWKSESVTIFELLDYNWQFLEMENFSKILSNHRKWLKLYRDSKLIEAKKIFKENKKLWDKVAEAFLDRIDSMDVNKDWDWIREFTEK